MTTERSHSSLPIARLKLGMLFALYAALLWGLYRSSLERVVTYWNRDDYTYAYLIPFVIAYLLWEKRHSLRNADTTGVWLGMAPLLLGILLFWLGELGGEFYALNLSFFLVLVGILWLHLGREKIRIMAFPLFLIVTTFPLPNFLYQKVSVNLQLIASKLGVTFLHWMGMSAYRQGNVIDLGFTQLQVVEACSGLRYVFALFVLGLILAHFFRAPFWKRAFLVFSTLPLTLFVNSARIALTGVLYKSWGPAVAEGFLHDFSSWAIFVFSFAVLLGEMWVLGKLKLPFGEPSAPPAEPSRGAQPPTAEAPAAPSAPLFTPRFLLALVLLGSTLLLSQVIDYRQKIPIRQALDSFPLAVDSWHGTREAMPPETRKELDLSDYIIVNYQDGNGKSVNFYVAYYETQRKGESIHTPETCLPGSGWIFTEAAPRTLPVRSYGNGSLTVNRVIMRKLDSSSLAYFWFPQRGRILTNVYQLKLFNFWDALTRQRTDGALVRVITPVFNTETLEQAESRLQGFVLRVAPLLDQYLPGEEPGPR